MNRFCTSTVACVIIQTFLSGHSFEAAALKQESHCKQSIGSIFWFCFRICVKYITWEDNGYYCDVQLLFGPQVKHIPVFCSLNKNLTLHRPSMGSKAFVQ